jgi:hypothetical protein
MKRFLAFLFMISFNGAALADYPRQCLNANWKPDGCSFPYLAAIVIPQQLGGSSQENVDYWNDRFYDACNNHDYCYGTSGVTKASCDEGFKREMIDLQCDQGNDSTCFGVAMIYYSGVVHLGGDAFDNGQDCGCTEDGNTTMSGSARDDRCG